MKFIKGTLISVFIILCFWQANANSETDSIQPFKAYGTNFDSVINEVLDVYKIIDKDQIVFVEKDIKTTMATRPKMDFIFRKKRNRIYKIFIDTIVRDSNGLLLRHLPHDALVGILAHEFAHIIDYEMHSNSGIISIGFSYSHTRGKVEVENRVDSITMEYGFIKESIAFAEFLASTGLVSQEYKDFKASIYNSVSELKAMGKRIKERKRKQERLARKRERKLKKENKIKKTE